MRKKILIVAIFLIAFVVLLILLNLNWREHISCLLTGGKYVEGVVYGECPRDPRGEVIPCENVSFEYFCMTNSVE